MKPIILSILFLGFLFVSCLTDNNNSGQLSIPKTKPTANEMAENADSVDIFGRKWTPCVMTAPRVLQKSDGFSGGNIYTVLVYVEEDYFGEEQFQNVGYSKWEE